MKGDKTLKLNKPNKLHEPNELWHPLPITIIVFIVLALLFLASPFAVGAEEQEAPDLVFEKYIRFNVTGNATDGVRANYSANFNRTSQYHLEIRSVDSQASLRANFSIREDKMIGSTKYNLSGWWNTLEEKIGDSKLTNDECRAVASGVELAGREIVGSGLAKTMLDNSYISQYHKATGKAGHATASAAFIDIYQDEETGNTTRVSVFNTVTFSGDHDGQWAIRYSFADPIMEEEEIEWWGSICGSITGWTMPDLSPEGQWLK